MVKLHLLEKLNSLQEVFQANDIKFSFLVKKDNDFYQITTPAKCREYFNEFLMKNHHPTEFTFVPTHGFNYKYEESPWDISTTYMSMKFPNKTLLATFKKNVKFLHAVEDYNKVDRTVIKPTDQENTVVILASSFWNSQCILMNIFTWILKLCSLNIQFKSHKELQDIHYNASEIQYLNTITPKTFNKLLGNLHTLQAPLSKYVDGTDKIEGNYVVHNSRGIIAITNTVLQKRSVEFSAKFLETFKVIFNVDKPAVEFLKETS